ncbi:BA14K family protein [Chthonobacter rhizosphaerae]|uniref:BA14K family protein n=1 Tax=Chthonobacter rhizosphaerae TaxID=2735553 RepID=UPI001FE73D31|nr:BA14K family protein [Chthonobacter rhizosphaerae]
MSHHTPTFLVRGLRSAMAGLLAGAVVLTSTMAGIAPASASPAAAARAAAPVADGAPVVTVQSREEWRRWRRGDTDRRDYWRPDRDDRRSWRDRDRYRDRDRRYYRRDRDRNDLAAGLGGLAAGALLGGVIANSLGNNGPVARADAPPAGGYAYGTRGYYEYCSSKYRSFRPETGTFTGYDGRTYYCR